MKIKVKGLVFVGAAAAIMLSAGAANAAKTPRTPAASTASVVTSQKYTESTYEYVADKVSAITDDNKGSEDQYPSNKAATDYLQKKVGGTMTSNTNTDGKLVTATSEAGSVVYTDITKSTSNNAASGTGWYATNPENRALSDYEVPSEKAMVEYVDTGLNTLKTNLGGDGNKQNYSNSSSGVYKVGHTGQTWATLGANDYVSIDNTTDVNAPKIQLASGRITTAVTDVNSTTGTAASNLVTASAVQKKQTVDKYQVSKNKEWTDASGAVDGGTYVGVDKTTRTDGGVDLDIKSTMIQSANSDANGNDPADNVNVAGNSAKLATAGVVQRKQTADKYQVSKNKEWTDLYGAVNVDNNGFITKTDNTSTGAVTLNVNAVKTAAAIGSASNADSTTLVTDYAVKQYVATAGLGGELAAMPDACKYTDAHCALVSTWDGTKAVLNWTVMAGAEHVAP